MTATFLDTSFLIALIRSKDQDHAVALQWRDRLRGPFVTSEYVLLEFLDASAPASLRRRGMEASKLLQNDRMVEVVHMSEQWMNAGIQWYSSHGDKDWGLTDCISFAIMQSKGLQDALTSDRHFEQAGFRALMRTKVDG